MFIHCCNCAFVEIIDEIFVQMLLIDNFARLRVNIDYKMILHGENKSCVSNQYFVFTRDETFNFFQTQTSNKTTTD